MPALIGPLKRTYPIARPEDVVVRGHKVYVRMGGVEKKVGITRWLADTEQWDRFVERLAARGAHVG